MIKKIGIGIVLLIAVILGYAALQPADYTIVREINVKASPEKIFPYLNNTKLGDQWGPWTEIDPQAKMVHSGPEEGAGAKTSWDSPGQMGTGSATVTESVPNQKVSIKLEYSKPMAMQQDAEYTVRQAGNESVVAWKVTGKNTFPGRVVCLFMNMDKMVGGMFEKGLGNLKAIVEKSN